MSIKSKLQMLAKGFSCKGDVISADRLARIAIEYGVEHEQITKEAHELKELVTIISLNSSFQTSMPYEADLVDALLTKLQSEG